MTQAGQVHFTLKIQGVSSALDVSSFELHEGMSELYAAHVRFVSHDLDIQFDDVVGKQATLEILRGDADTPRYVTGIVSRLERGGDAPKRALYFATIVPTAWRALHRFDIRIFQAKNVVDIAKAVLAGAGITHTRFETQKSYSPRDYCVQYRESDWAFVSRLFEEEGIYYFFEHADGKDTLVVADADGGHAPLEGGDKLAYHVQGGAMAHDEAVRAFLLAQEVRTGKASLTDYNFEKPTLSLAQSASAAQGTDLEAYDYPGEYDAPADGTAYAKVRLAEQQAGRQTGRGQSTVARLVPGYQFTLEDHPHGAFNGTYLVTRVVHEGAQPVGTDDTATAHRYTNDFEVMLSSVPFRPLRRTPRPRVNGLESAIVVGPAGEEIHTDKHGRVKVQFHWDRLGKKDEHSSCWIRVSQLWAGAGWGAMFIPRIGHEVLVDFLSGDPDRPVIVGRVYHGQNVPPYTLPAEKTKSTVKSNSSPGGNGSNELRFEDKAGSEEIYLHGQKDWNIKIEHDKAQRIGHDEALDVGHDQTIAIHHDRQKKVDHDQSETIGNDKSISVGGDHDEDITGNESLHVGGDADRAVDGNYGITVQKDQSYDVTGGWTQSVGKDYTLDVAGSSAVSVGKDGALSIGGDRTEDVTGSATTTIGKDASVSVTDNFKQNIGKEAKVSAGDLYTLTVGDGSISVKKDGTIVVKGKDISIKGTGKIQIEASNKVSIKTDAGVDLEASGAVKIKGSTVGIN